MQCHIFSMAYIFWSNSCGQFFCLVSCHLQLSNHMLVQSSKWSHGQEPDWKSNQWWYSRTFHFDSPLKAFVKQWIHSMPVGECSQLSSLIDGILPTGLLWGGRAWNVLTFPLILLWALDMFWAGSHGYYSLENNHEVSKFSCPVKSHYELKQYRVYSKSYCKLALFLQSFALYWCMTFLSLPAT